MNLTSQLYYMLSVQNISNIQYSLYWVPIFHNPCVKTKKSIIDLSPPRYLKLPFMIEVDLS